MLQVWISRDQGGRWRWWDDHERPSEADGERDIIRADAKVLRLVAVLRRAAIRNRDPGKTTEAFQQACEQAIRDARRKPRL